MKNINLLSLVQGALGLLAIFVLVAELAWMIRDEQRFVVYQHGWEAAHSRWETANAQDDLLACLEALKEQRLYLDAQFLVHDDLLILPTRIIERWNYEYLSEARM